MSNNFQSIVEASEFLQDYQTYLDCNQDSSETLVAQTLSQQKQTLSKPSGPCACDNCTFQPPQPNFSF
ncbi:MAG: hypothetical protein DKT66_01160 [Candidatus Melainabacteria bacterium]|nr:MAG: hypothetical protein DKT66_01160 [Candidatus Melainabacteria bacterium]